MIRRLVLLLVGTLASADDFDGWYPCEVGAKASAQCAIFRAPLCHVGVCDDASNRTLDVFAQRVVASHRPAAQPNVVFVRGSSSFNYEGAMQSIAASLEGNVNVYSIDRRGFGRSSALDCVAAQAQTANSPAGVSIAPNEVASCADELGSKYSGTLAAFSLTSAAFDIRYFIDTFLNSTAPTFVYGAGRSSAIVERLMHLNVSRITGYILDGVATTSGAPVANFPYDSNWDVAYDRVGQDFLSLCRDDSVCGAFFPNGTLATAVSSLLKNLDAPRSKCTLALDAQLTDVFANAPGDNAPSKKVRWAMGELLRHATLRKLIPVVIYRLSRCTPDDAKALEHFFATLATMLRSRVDDRATLLSKLVSFSEVWELPTPADEILDARFQASAITTGTYSVQTYCAFTKDSTSACAPHAAFANYSAPPLVYKRDPFWNVAASPVGNASVLVLSGTLDPVTPHANGVTWLNALATANKRLVTFEHATHGALWHTPTRDRSSASCGVAVLASYIRQNGNLSHLDTSCVTKVAPLSFAIEKDVAATWLGASSAYDGGLLSGNSGSSSKNLLVTPYKLAIIALGVLLGLASVVACVLLVQWRRVKRRRLTFSVDDPAYDACRA